MWFLPWNFSQDSVKSKSSHRLKKRLEEFIEKKIIEGFLYIEAGWFGDSLTKKDVWCQISFKLLCIISDNWFFANT